jgi:hypothetical protein
MRCPSNIFAVITVDYNCGNLWTCGKTQIAELGHNTGI